MKGSEILNKTLSILGYSEPDGNIHLSQVVRNRALPLLNICVAELSRCTGVEYSPIASLSDEINLEGAALYEALPTGMAMYIAVALSDSAAASFFTEQYRKKKASLSRVSGIKDTLPRPQ